MKALAAIRQYFGFRAEEFRGDNEDGSRRSGMQDFSDELKRLSPEEKQELAEGAAKELGVELEA